MKSHHNLWTIICLSSTMKMMYKTVFVRVAIDILEEISYPFIRSLFLRCSLGYHLSQFNYNQDPLWRTQQCEGASSDLDCLSIALILAVQVLKYCITLIIWSRYKFRCEITWNILPSIKLLAKIYCSLNICQFYDSPFDVDFCSEHETALSHNQFNHECWWWRKFV